MEIILQLFILIFGFLLLVKGADFFVDGSSKIAKKFGIPELIIGLTIVAMGTSAPETAVSIAAALKGTADISIGNVVGSNILNILIILGISATIRTIKVGKTTIKYEIPFMIAISALLLLLGLDGTIDFKDGIILWLLFIAYLTYLIIMAKKDKQKKEKKSKVILWQAILATLGGLALIIVGSDISVDAASKIARYAGLSERFIGLTIVALGTSLPELVTSVTAAFKGNNDIAIGNIVGSNIFNILFVIGTSSLILPITFASTFKIDSLVMIGAALLLFICSLRKQKLDRFSGILMLLSYALYFILVLI
jgi:cation:H+ antiporter